MVLEVQSNFTACNISVTMATEKLIKITIRPKDGDWIMGDDWEIEIPDSTTIVGLKKYIELHKGISAYRIQIRLQTLKLCASNKEVWSLRRLGFSSGALFYCEPTNPSRGWIWNDIDYYKEKLLCEVADQINKANGRINVEELSKLVQVPPCIKTSLRVFLRQYPDRAFIRTDLTSGILWVQNANPNGFQLPTFETLPVEIGEIRDNAFYDINKEFDWASYKDVDDTKLVVSGIRIPDIAYEFSLVECFNLYANDPFKNYTIYAIMYFNGAEKARSTFRRNTRYPKWNGDARFRIAIAPSTELNTCTILVEFYDIEAVDNIFSNPFEKGRFLGCLDLHGQAMPELFSNRSVTMKEFPLTPRRKTKLKKVKLQLTMAQIEAGDVDGDESDQEDEIINHDDDDAIVTGTVTVKAGPASYEMVIDGAKSIIQVADEKSFPFCVAVWNGKEVYKTMSSSIINPTWENDRFQVTVPGSKPLQECELEIQIWASVPVLTGQAAKDAAAALAREAEDGHRKGKKKKAGDTKGDFMGSVNLQGQELFKFFRNSDGAEDPDEEIIGPDSNYIWASHIINRPLSKSLNIPPSEKLKPVRGSISMTGGYPGLYRCRGRQFAITVVQATKIGKFKGLCCMVFWNHVKIGLSGRAPVKTVESHIVNADGSTTSIFDNSANFILPSDYVGMKNKCTFILDTPITPDDRKRSKSHVLNCHLKLELYEMGTQGTVGNFCGCVVVEGEDLVELLDMKGEFLEPENEVSESPHKKSKPVEDGGVDSSEGVEGLSADGSSELAVGSAGDSSGAIQVKKGNVVLRREYDLIPDPAKVAQTSKQIQGKLSLWGGLSYGRKPYERIIIIRACKNIPIPKFLPPPTPPTPSTPYGRPETPATPASGLPPTPVLNAQLIVKYNSKVIAKSMIVPDCCNPSFDKMYVNIPYAGPTPEEDARLIGRLDRCVFFIN